MATDRQLDETISRWLEAEAPMQLPDRVLRATFERTRKTRQQGGWRALLGRMHVNRLVFALGGAAVVVVAAALALGLYVNNPSSGVGGPGIEPTPIAEASVAEPSAEPSVAEPSSAPPGLPVGGTYFISLAVDPIAISVTIPAPGWDGDPGGGVLIKTHEDPPDGAGLITFSVDDGYFVYGDPCQWSTTRPDTLATTVDELVAALAAQASRDASAPVDITLDGYAGKSITLHVPDDANFAECDDGKFASWGQPGDDPSRYHQGPGQIDKLWILDLDGHLVVIDTAYYAGTPQDVVDELDAIVESATVEGP